MKQSRFTLSIFLAAAILATMRGAYAVESRYFYGGDGVIDISSAKNGFVFKGVYRTSEGQFIDAALKKIDRVFDAAPKSNMQIIEPRFIEFLDYLQDELNGGRIVVMSGYRSPNYNQNLRKWGKLAGKASMHQYGMAADIRMKGVPPEKIWHFVRELGYGGVGYYHGFSAHVDVGPARFWDETTSKVGTTHADDNKLITLIPHQDIYYPGEELKLRFVRMTAYPIGVNKNLVLERQRGKKWRKAQSFSPRFIKVSSSDCPKFLSIDEMNDIKWTLPRKLKPGRYRVRAKFCEKEWEAMPDEIASYEFMVEKR